MGWADLVRRDGERLGRMGELIRRGVKGIPVMRSFEEEDAQFPIATAKPMRKGAMPEVA